MNDCPNRVVINLEILMNKEVTHVGDGTPFYFRMSFLEQRSKHIDCFTNNLDILHNTIISENIGLQLFS